MSTIHLACASGVDYVPHAATMLHSMLGQRGDSELHVHYLHGAEIGEELRDPIAAMVDAEGGAIEFVEVAEELIAGLPPSGYLLRTMWFRTFLPELAPDLDKVLYVDVDTLAVDAIEPLWETPLGDSYVGAVTNVWEPWNAQRGGEIGLADPGSYFNSGVLLMNLQAMRRDDCTRAIVEHGLAHRDHLPFGDQDALNVVLGERRVHLHPRWNCMNSVLEFPQAVDVFGAQAVAEARANPGIRHFEGPSVNKPWHAACEHRMRELYATHRAHTPWPEWEPEHDPAPPPPRRGLRARLAGLLRP